MSREQLENAGRLHRAGKHAEAAAIYGELLRQNPAHFEALRDFGVLSYQLGEIESAERLIGEAARLRPGTAELSYNHACLLQRLNRLEEARAAFDRALAMRPNYFEALVNRGAVLGALNRRDEALADWDRAVALNPAHGMAWKNRGLILQQAGRPDDALVSLRKASELLPTDADAQGRLADLLTSMGGYAEAASAYERFLALAPDRAGGWHARAFVLQILHRREEALACFERALQLQPKNDAIRTGRANILFELERWEDAARDYEVLLAAESPPAWTRGYLAICRLHCCDWRRMESDREFIRAAIRRGEFVIDPIGMAAISDSPDEQFDCARIWARDRCPPVSPLWTGEAYHHDRIRIAYLSSDFRAHATAFLMAGIFEKHDRARFEVTAISWSANDRSPTRERLERAFDRFVEAGDRSDYDAARLMRDLEIDIAIDLKGFTNESRPAILAHRPAPVQAQYLGFPGTMAVDFIDYLIADPVVIPPADQRHYAEKIVTLPDSYQCNDDTREIPLRPPTRYEVGLPPGFVFCCFNSNHKILPEVFAVWMRLLNATSGSVLWLLEDNLSAARNLRAEAEAHGVEAERLVFAKHTDPATHLARQTNADLFLDTLPYNAHTTGSDALWAGLPVVTVRGKTFAGRVAASLLGAVGLPELATDSLEQYEALALKLARDGEALARIKCKLAASRKSCALFDTARMTRHLEAAYQMMWQRKQRGLPVESFSVPPR
ncbi:MAG TPA: tetratricopeptide repeat protein [Micropepsaceae bacterium]|nr:tetratricopeptide repeat protein [Micropepsaceae bacterium]